MAKLHIRVLRRLTLENNNNFQFEFDTAEKPSLSCGINTSPKGEKCRYLYKDLQDLLSPFRYTFKDALKCESKALFSFRFFPFRLLFKKNLV